MEFAKNTTVSLREGFRTPNGTLAWSEVLSCTTAGIIVLAFFLGPYQRWHTNPVVKLLFSAAGRLAETMLKSTFTVMLVDSQYSSELYLVWAVFLVIACVSLDATSGYNLYTSNKERMEFEMSQFLDNVSVALLLAVLPGHSKFKRPLWALWCLIMVQWTQRIWSFRVPHRRYGTENINLVAHYMSYEHELTSLFGNEVNPTDMKGYKYLVVGEDEAKTETRAPEYLLRLDVMDSKVITIDNVWECQGRLLRSGGKDGRRLKDVCLSFALFKLLRRRFFNYSAAEADHAKTHDFVFRGLLMEEDHKRAFGVIKVELEFLYDLFYTNYPITFSTWFSIFCVLKISIIMASVWTVVRALHNYQTPKQDLNRIVSGKNVDAIITHVFVIPIIIMEVWEFFTYLLSDWAKVMLTCNYVKHPKLQDFFCLDKVLRIVCRGKLWRPLRDKIGQYSLLENFRYTNFNIPYFVTCGFGADKKGKGVRKQDAVELSEEVKEAIILSLKRSEGRLSNGKLSLRRNRVSEELFWACRLPSHTHTIMVWHIATGYFEMTTSPKIIGHQKDTDPHRLVATTLSRYCAYLLVFAPEFLPVNPFAVKYMFENIVSETKTFFKEFKSKDRMCEKVMQTGDTGDQKIIEMGAKLAKQLAMDVEDEERRWKVLAEFWAELILFLAPSDDATAHKEKLATGGEFITYLWALLYHAGILERPQSSHVDTAAAFPV